MSCERRIGLMGGTFDPIHVGHLAIAVEARRALGLEEVVFVPAGQPWQKAAVAAAADRLAMTHLAVDGAPGCRVSAIEIDREGPTYTVDTLRALHAEDPEAELWLLLGADALAGLDSWREPGEIVRLAKVAVAARPGSEPRADGGGVAVTVLELEPVAVSSRDIRARLARGESVQGLVPTAVETYIHAHGLYGAGAAA